MKTDFDKWLNYHCGAYPGFLRWLEDDSNKAQVEHMRRLLGHYTIDQLQQATDALYAMDDQPNGYSNHARAIRRLCNPETTNTASADEGPRVIDDHLTAECTRCMDYGIVEVLSPACLKQLLGGTPAQPYPILTTCTLACDCRLGAAKARRVKIPQWVDGHTLIRFETVLERAIGQEKHHQSIDHAQWEVAKQLLQEHHARWHHSQELTAEALP